MDGSVFNNLASSNNIGELVHRVAETTPASPAFMQLDGSPLAYDRLAALIEETGETLNNRGIGRGDRVAGVLSPGIHQSTCLLAVSTFATYAPLSPEWTAHEYEEYLARIAPKAVILEEGLKTPARKAARARGIQVFDLTRDQSGPVGVYSLHGEPQGGCLHPGPAGADDIAVILPSSGTTSQPKLVPCANRQMLALAEARQKQFQLTCDDRCLLEYSLSHGGGIRGDVFVLLGLGATIIGGFPFSAERFFRELDEFQPTFMCATHTVLQTVARHLDAHNASVERARSMMRFIRLSAAPMALTTIAKLERAFDAPLIECYASSEMGWITANPLPPGIRKHGTVGTVFGNNVAIMDGGGELLPSGREGEIVVRGPSVMQGYLDDPAGTAEAFVGDWYRTGDIGRFDQEGYLSLVGRLKEMINQGGQKVAPVEVDRVLERHPAVADAATFPAPHESLGEAVGAALVLKPEATVDDAELRRFCLEYLAPYKVPRLIYHVDRIPRDANGKIPRLRLFQELGLDAPPVLSPRKTKRRLSPTEAALAGLWASVLEVESVGIEDDFFALGGDSLQAATLFAEVANVFSAELPLETVLHEASTVARMADVIERERDNSGAPVNAVPPKVSTLVPISEHRGGRCIFAVPGIGGNAVGFAHLARELGTGYSIYGFQSRGLDGSQEPVYRIDETARLNLAELLSMQPEGPYRLFGACFGAIVAFEMAQQLRAAGKEVGLLAMLDPPGESLATTRGVGSAYRMPSRFPTLRFISDRLGLYFRQIKDLDGPGRGEFLKEKLSVAGQVITQRDLFRGDRAELNQAAVIEANYAAVQSYSPEPYGGPAVILLSGDRETVTTEDLRLKWFDLVPQGSQARYVPGRDSGTALKPPNVESLGQILTAEI